MAKDTSNQFPSVPSPGPLTKTIDQLRKSFPPTVTSATLQKLALAPSNEGYVINVLRFLGVLDEEGAQRPEARKLFADADEGFASGLATLVESAYADLFTLHGPEAWELPKDRLTVFFRQANGSTQTVGERQAGTFITLAGLAGRRTLPSVRPVETNPKKLTTKKKVGRNSEAAQDSGPGASATRPERQGQLQSDTAFGLTLRIEVNLPAGGDQETYDRIFRSIRENLLDARVG